MANLKNSEPDFPKSNVGNFSKDFRPQMAIQNKDYFSRLKRNHQQLPEDERKVIVGGCLLSLLMQI